MIEMSLKKNKDKLHSALQENDILVMKYESLQAKSKGEENEFIFKYEELKSELEQKFNDIKEEYTQIQTEMRNGLPSWSKKTVSSKGKRTVSQRNGMQGR